MLWFEKKIISKEEKLPWIEVVYLQDEVANEKEEFSRNLEQKLKELEGSLDLAEATPQEITAFGEDKTSKQSSMEEKGESQARSNITYYPTKFIYVWEKKEQKSQPSCEYFFPLSSLAKREENPRQEEKCTLEETGFSQKEKIKEEEKRQDRENTSAHSEEYERASITPVVRRLGGIDEPWKLLRSGTSMDGVVDFQETQSVISRLEETLQQFGIEGKVIGVQRGPIITRYELKLAPGIKVSRILSLTDELAMALEALRVRIEAPIPGRSTVGVEIPNRKRSQVRLGDLLAEPAWAEFKAELGLPLGRDIAGNPVYIDLTRMPHLLVAGATGSGKSVAINAFISSFILTKTPEEIRFLLVDPKLVELSHYNDIPHLLHPVITDAQKAVLALNWAVEEMERRYEDLAEMRVRDIRSYNQRLKQLQNEKRIIDEEFPPMPYIVILIDELGDLMMVAGKEVEGSIIRLSQKARAVGIHLILATQRPSVDVITALIKANCPARIALQVAQKTDSRTILDANGAEQLVGQGDLLFKHPNRGELLRIQAPLVEDEEVEKVVEYARGLGQPSYIVLEDPKANSAQLEEEDEELFEVAWQIILESGKASASYLQRRLRIGYNRAARLIEAFEARGMIGPQIGSKPREILQR
ncbi:MAG: DNA translocase FtsK [Leptospiraceae bacterium]|nr:DNA translocase FtsK [Leptospiraceae bacterium]MDW8305833.1 DNA translocase FtsK [Leptospiraceae bacterium]